MASESEASNPGKGLSFIDWEDLDEEVFVKLDRIINTPQERSGVQLPFSCDEHVEVPHKPEPAVNVHVPVFQPNVPPPPMVSYPVPVHWRHGDPNLVQQAGTPYPITAHSGFMFQNPPLPASGGATVAFVNGHPVYAIPGMGHPIPAHFQGPPIPHSESGDAMDVPITGHPSGVVMQPMGHSNGPLMPGVSPTQPVNPHGDLGLSSASVTVSHPGMGVPPATQVVFIPQPPVLPPTISQSCQESPVYADRHEVKQLPNVQVTQTVGVTGLPPRQQSSSGIEFGGLVYESNSEKSVHSEEQNNNMLLKSNERLTDVDKQLVIDITNVNITNKEKIVTDSTDDASSCVPQVPGNSDKIQHVADGSPDKLLSDQTPEKEGIDDTNTDSTPEDIQKLSSPPQTLPAHSQQTVKSWSSLFTGVSQTEKRSTNNAKNCVTTLPSPVANINDSSFPSLSDFHHKDNRDSVDKAMCVPREKVTTVGVQSDPLAHQILDQLFNLPIKHTPIVIQPRGLKNGQNTCFLNAPLQVLMGCPPFVHMFRSFTNLPTRTESSTPILDSLVQFVNSFQNGQRMRNPGSRNKKGTPVDLNIGQSFIPGALLNVAQNILGLHIGVQHDAEEFLSQILSICHEEMENILKLSDVNGNGVKKAEEAQQQVNGSTLVNDNHTDEDMDNNDEAWQKVGPKNHYVETNVNDCGRTPLSNVFAGLSRSCLVKESGKTSDTLDSFFTLKLDIQTESVHSVKEALLRLNTTETVHDADGRKIHGQRRMFFDTLPPVLIMHLKLFEYSNGNGQKIQKKVTFDVDLHIPKEILSRVGKLKYTSAKARAYKLFGVVNHHGRKMNDGHYTSDVFLPVASGWLRFDDSEIIAIQEADVLYYNERSMPYLLFYRRMDVTV